MTINKESTLIYEDKVYKADEIISHIEYVKCELLKVKEINSSPVAIYLDRTPELIFSMFALLEMKIPFVIINNKIPVKRMNYMLNNIGVKYIISKTDLPTDVCIIDIDFNHRRMGEKSNWTNDNYWSEIAYVLYTSGTSGNSKAVEVKRIGLKNFIEAIPKRIHSLNNKRIASFTNSMFDIFFLETIMALSIGMKVYLANEKECANPRMMLDIIHNKEIQVLQMTPSGIQMLEMCDQSFCMLERIEILMIGGEVFPNKLLCKLRKHIKGRIFNMYGPTETTIWSSIADLTNENNVHVGKPVLNTEIYVLNSQGNRVKDGKTGEICISGLGLARRYTDNPILTKKCFENVEGKRFYFTGDIGRINERGNLECLGRLDNQIKFHGHRIELEEVEDALTEIPSIKNACVCFDKSEGKMIAFVVSDNDISSSDVKKEMKELLPIYMIPNIVSVVSDLKYTENGKKNRNEMIRLYRIQQDSVSNDIVIEAENIKKRIFNLIKLHFQNNIDEIDNDLTFELMGVDSLEYIALVVDIEEELSIEIEDKLLDVNYSSTINEFIIYISKIVEEKQEMDNN